MASQTDICNMALSYLGANLIIEITDETLEARLCNLNYDTCRDAVLEDGEWTFATKRYKFTSPLSNTPTYEFSNAFLIPAEVLRVLEVNNNNAEWRLEDRNILTNSSTIEFRAIVRVVDTTQFSPSFIKALAAFIAAEIALPITNSPGMAQNMTQLYMMKVSAAKANDGRQGRSRRRYTSGIVR